MLNTAVKNELGLILSDFIKMFFIYSCKEKPFPSFNIAERYKEIVDELNDGQCYTVASHCAYILKQHYPDADIKIVTNKYHCWIEVEGKPFDTLFPDGYPVPVNEMWYPDNTERWDTSPLRQEVGDEPNKGRWDWVLIYTFKSLCETWEVKYPDYMKEYEEGARQTDIQCIRPEEEEIMKGIKAATPLPWPRGNSVVRTFQFPKTHPNYKSPEGTKPVQSVHLNQAKLTLQLRPKFKDCNRLEKSFREVLKDKPCGINPAEYIKILKDITHQSFDGLNIFRLWAFEGGATVKVHSEEFRNVYCEKEWYDRYGYRKSLYRAFLTGMSFPIKMKHNSVFSKARMVISVCDHTYHYQIAIQLLNEQTRAWCDIPVNTNNVKEVLHELTQETM